MGANSTKKALSWFAIFFLWIKTFCLWLWIYTLFAAGSQEVLTILSAYHAWFFCCDVVAGIVRPGHWTVIHIFIGFLCFDSDVHIVTIFLPIRSGSLVVLIKPIYLFCLSLSSDIKFFVFGIRAIALNFTNFPLDLLLKQRRLLFLYLLLLTQLLEVHFLIEIAHDLISLEFRTHPIDSFP